MKFFIIFLNFFISINVFGQNLKISPLPNSSSIINLDTNQSLIYLSNLNSSGAIPINLSLSPNSGFSIASDRCSGKSLKPKTSCYFLINIQNQNLSSGVNSVSVNNNGNFLLTLEKTKIELNETSLFSISSLNLDNFLSRSISIVNRSSITRSYNPVILGTNADKYEILSNRCQNVLSGRSCLFSIKLKSQPAVNLTATISEPQILDSIVVSSTINSSTSGVLPQTVTSLSLSSNNLNFGTIKQYGLSHAQNVTITNTGNSILNPILELSSGAHLIFNRCSSLPAGKSCSISVGVKPAVGTPNGTLSESVLVKKNAGDSGLSIALSANLSVNVAASCPVNQHLESGNCVSNVRSCPISNGSGSQNWNSGSWGSCSVSSCNSGYYQSLNSCALITYSAMYSSYSPNPASVQACDGNVISTRSIISCMRDDNFAFVSNSNCIDLASSISTDSPAGNINVSISNGSETRSCALGSSSQSFVSRSCNSGFYDDGSSCQSVVYISSYSSYSPSIPSSQNICDGTVISTRTITDCNQQHDNQSVSTSFCSDPSPTVVSESPAGNVNVSIPNGSEERSCSLGSSLQNFVSRSCDAGFFNDGSSCQAIVYLATYSSYIPAIPSSQNVCDGTVVSSRTISNCIQEHDSQSVSTSLCSDLNPTVISQSPSGSFNVSISNGSEVRSCALGSSTQVVDSRSCDAGFYNDSSNCTVIPTNQIAINSLTAPVISPLPAGTHNYSPVIASTISAQSFTAPTHAAFSANSPNLLSSAQNVGTPPASESILPDGSGNYTLSNNQQYSLSTIISNTINGIFTDIANYFSSNIIKYSFSQITNINNGGNDNPAGILVLNNELYFVANINASSHRKLFKVNTSGVVSQVSNTNSVGNDNPAGPAFFNNELYFTALNSSNHFKLFKVNSAGTVSQVTNIFSGGSDATGFLTVFNNELYFVANINAANRKLFKVNTSGVVSQVSNINSNDDSPSNFRIYNNEMYFSASIANLQKTFKINSSGVISQVSNINNGSGDFFESLAIYNNEMYFSANINTSSHKKLFKIDSSGIISQVANTNNGGNDTPFQAIVFNNELYFFSFINASNHRKIFKVNTSGVVSQVSNIFDGGNDNPSAMTVFNNEMYFSAAINASNHRKLFKVNTSGTVSQITNIVNGGNDNIGIPIVFNNELYFAAAINASNHRKIFKINTSGVISQVSNINNAGSDFADLFTVFNNELYFRGSIDNSNQKLIKLKIE